MTMSNDHPIDFIFTIRDLISWAFFFCHFASDYIILFELFERPTALSFSSISSFVMSDLSSGEKTKLCCFGGVHLRLHVMTYVQFKSCSWFAIDAVGFGGVLLFSFRNLLIVFCLVEWIYLYWMFFVVLIQTGSLFKIKNKFLLKIKLEVKQNYLCWKSCANLRLTLTNITRVTFSLNINVTLFLELCKQYCHRFFKNFCSIDLRFFFG